MLALFDYGLIVVFFVGLFALVLVIARPPRSERSSAQQSVTTQPATTIDTPQVKQISYAALLAFFIALCVVTMLSGRAQEKGKL